MSIYNNFWLTRMEDLAQNTSIEEYYLQFDALRGLVEYTDPFIPESHYTSLFINGLATEVHAYVEGFFPITILDAYSLACIFVNGYSRCFPLSPANVVVTETQEVAEPIEPVENNFVPLLEDAEHPEDVDDYTVMVKDISVPFTVQHNDIGRLKTEASTAITVPSFSATSIDSSNIGHSLSVDVDISYDIGENQESANGCAIKNVTQEKWGFSKFCFDPGIFLLYPDLVYSSNHGLVEDSMGEVIYRSGIAQGSIMFSDICVDTRVFPCFLCVLNASDSSNIRDEFLGSCLSLCFTVEAKPVVECDYIPEQVVSYTIAASLNDINLEEHEEVPIPHTDVLVTVLAQEDKGGTVLHMPTFLATVSRVSHKLVAPMECWFIVWLTPTFVKHFGFQLVGILHQLLFLLMCSDSMLEALALVFLLIQDIVSADYLLVLVVPWNGYIPISGCYRQVICIFIWSDTSFYLLDDGFHSLTVVQMHGTALLLPFRVQLLQWSYPKCLLIAVLKCSLSRPQDSTQVLHAALATSIARCNISCGVYGSRMLVTITKTFEKLAFRASHVFWRLMARHIKFRPVKVNGRAQGTKFYIADDVLIMLGLSCYANFLGMPSPQDSPSSYALIPIPPLMVLQGMVELQELCRAAKEIEATVTPLCTPLSAICLQQCLASSGRPPPIETVHSFPPLLLRVSLDCQQSQVISAITVIEQPSSVLPDFAHVIFWTNELMLSTDNVSISYAIQYGVLDNTLDKRGTVRLDVEMGTPDTLPHKVLHQQPTRIHQCCSIVRIIFRKDGDTHDSDSLSSVGVITNVNTERATNGISQGGGFDSSNSHATIVKFQRNIHMVVSLFLTALLVCKVSSSACYYFVRLQVIHQFVYKIWGIDDKALAFTTYAFSGIFVDVDKALVSTVHLVELVSSLASFWFTVIVFSNSLSTCTDWYSHEMECF